MALARLPAKSRPSPQDVGPTLLVLPFILAILAYARTLHGEFQWDDFHSIVENGGVKDLGGRLNGFLGALLHSGRPVTELTFALNHAVGGLEPFGYHLVNLAIHLGVVALVYSFTRTVFDLADGPAPGPSSLVVAGLFALHPLQTQAVSYVSQRSESLASGAYLGGLLLLLAAERRGPGGRGVAAYVAGLVVFVLGLGSKVIIVTLPAAYILMTWMLPSARERTKLATWPRRLALLAPYAIVDLYLSTRTLQSMEGAVDAGFSIPGLPPVTYFLTQWQVVWTYLRLLFWPSGQLVDWFFPPARGIGEPQVLLAGALLLVLLAGAGLLLLRSRSWQGVKAGAGRIAAFGVSWFFLVLAPTSTVVPLADVIEEHRVYLASWGIFAAFVAGGAWVFQRARARRRSAAAIALVVVAWSVLTWLTYRRNAAWETRVALWTGEVAGRPANWRAHLNLGFALQERGKNEGALREFRQALSLGGASTPATESFILNNIGAVLVNAGRGSEAMAAYRRALELRPRDADIVYNLANLSKDQGDLAAAEGLAGKALALDPAHTPALNLLGHLRLERGEAAGALDLFRRASRADPDDSTSRFNAGAALGRLGRRDEACAIWRQVAADGHAAQPIRGLAAEALARENCPR